MSAYGLFSTECLDCGKSIPSYATDRQGTVPATFCNSLCKTNYGTGKNIVGDRKIIVPLKKTLTNEELAQRLSQTAYSNKYQHGINS